MYVQTCTCAGILEFGKTQRVLLIFYMYSRYMYIQSTIDSCVKIISSQLMVKSMGVVNTMRVR